MRSKTSLTKATSQNWQKNKTTRRKKEDGESPTTGSQNKQTKTTKHTIEFSNNTPQPGRADTPRLSSRRVERTGRNPRRSGSSSGMPSRSAAGPRRDDFHKLRQG